MKIKYEKGSVLVLLAVMMLTLIGVSALAIDVGRTWFESKKIQSGGDLAALAAVQQVQQGHTNTFVFNAADAMLTANDVNFVTEVLNKQCGTWNPYPSKGGIFTVVANCSNTAVNAVRVQTSRTVNSMFARILRISSLQPKMESIAMVLYPNSGPCIAPYAIELTALTAAGGVAVGAQFDVGGPSPGNWGKVDLGGINMSSGSNFPTYLTAGVCDSGNDMGDQISQATGGAQIDNAFATAKDAGQLERMVIAVTSNFQGGGKKVTIQKFVAVKYIGPGPAGGNGSNWQARFQLLEDPAVPPKGGGSGVPQFRYLAK
jgi:Flp pilus assembly protein TadG